MATIQEKLADSLAALKAYQDAHEDNLVIQKNLGDRHFDTPLPLKRMYFTFFAAGIPRNTTLMSEG